jgi:uncharacterized protein YbjQ (UPF0145 family)
MLTYKTNDMILTTTPTVEGRTIVEYKGIVFGEVITGVNFIKDFGASLRNFFGGRSGSYEKELLAARRSALAELEGRAREKGADAVVGIDIDYEVLGPNGGMLMVTASGTAVKLG